MTERDNYAAGTPSWIDLGTPDTDAAAAFYGGLFGWRVEEAGGPETGGYRMCMLKGQPVAGISPLQAEGMPPWWTTYITIDSADETAKAVEEAGGTTLVPPFDVLDAGRMAAFKDLGGAVFSVWEPKQHHGAGLANEPGTLTWNELSSRDLERAKQFYDDVFGWEAFEMDMGGGVTYTVWRLPGGDETGIGGGMTMGDQWPAGTPDHWMVYFSVADCDSSAAQVEELGGKVVVPPTDIPNVGRFALCNGPNDEIFSIIANPPEDENR